MTDYWQAFVEAHHLVGRQISVPDDLDVSGVGIEIEILGDEAIHSEQTAAYPGIAVVEAGYIPVGGCSIGTGDPYFINIHDGEGGPLYRIYHDEVVDQSYDAKAAIALVLEDYRELLNYLSH